MDLQANSGVAPVVPNCHNCLTITGFHKYPLFWEVKSMKSPFLMFLSSSYLLWHHTPLCLCQKNVIRVTLVTLLNPTYKWKCMLPVLIQKCVCPCVVSWSGRLYLERIFRELCLFVVWNPTLILTCLYFSWLKFKNKWRQNLKMKDH